MGKWSGKWSGKPAPTDHSNSSPLTYYNDNEQYVVRWLNNLKKAGCISDGFVDNRSIKKVQARDLEAFTRAHFFAGIGGWEVALELAGWPKEWPVWTGSCPCQPFSVAGRGAGFNDSRHLWPEFKRLISECRPPVVFGEQVASELGRDWLALVRTEMESLGYAVGCADLPAASVGTPHKRQRLYWVAYATGYRLERDMRKTPPQAVQHVPSQALAAWDGVGGVFGDWEKQLSAPRFRSVAARLHSTGETAPQLRALGNSIVPQVAAVFVRSFMECVA